MTIDRWLEELELMEALDRDEQARDVVLRMGRLAHRGRLDDFRDVVRDDTELDPATKAWVLEMARNEDFLLTVHGYADRLGDRH